ncbi:integral membrane protein [Cordyceps fumosorosea ARSEF 2679]|uniref:Integral membrane protein n=1 Tax=Cordyceps fumosorosea (strain ARSEF 2679) TaxID=1081104 RepID=A0A167MJ41_CORFA|nr:integral membrane protein [Cordyceps fumosorosea ARSEF 2679]OAA54417.1 integral membrane protein [Cordyceps fumosorosea ARSEF 2679]
MASRAAVPFLVAMMLLTGVCNTLLTKYQDMQCVRHCDGDPNKRKLFNQPVLQTAQMFVGEMGCWLVIGLMALYSRFFGNAAAVADTEYQAINTDEAADIGPDADAGADDDDRRKGSLLKGFGIVLLALPAVCDILGTTLMNAGLLLVAASIYQMTRGALVLFVGLFSVIFLRRHLFLFQWLALAGVVTGVAVVGLAGAIWPDEKVRNTGEAVTGDDADGLSDAARAIVGVLLIAGAQVFTATQFVLEEWILENSPIEPIRVVGWEGIFGFLVTVGGMVFMHLIVGRTEAGRYGAFDMVEGWREMTQYKPIWLTSLLIMISIGTLFIWVVSLGLGWESFKWLQILGFAILVYATFIFNGIVKPPLKSLCPDDEVEPLLAEDPIEHL